MKSKRTEFEQRGFDKAHYATCFAKNQEEYIRKKLRAVLLYHQGAKISHIAFSLSLHEQSVRTYLASYLTGGFDLLCKRIKRPKESLLTEQQQQLLKETLLTKRPYEVGLESNIWTGKTMCQYLKITFGVTYKAGVYDLLERLGLTHQKAHADYGNAKVAEQQAFLKGFKSAVLQADSKSSVVVFDEFSVCEKPSTAYGWAEKNTRPQFVTNEKKERARMAS